MSTLSDLDLDWIEQNLTGMKTGALDGWLRELGVSRISFNGPINRQSQPNCNCSVYALSPWLLVLLLPISFIYSVAALLRMKLTLFSLVFQQLNCASDPASDHQMAKYNKNCKGGNYRAGMWQQQQERSSGGLSRNSHIPIFMFQQPLLVSPYCHPIQWSINIGKRVVRPLYHMVEQLTKPKWNERQTKPLDQQRCNKITAFVTNHSSSSCHILVKLVDGDIT